MSVKVLALAALVLSVSSCAEFREPRLSQWNPQRKPIGCLPGDPRMRPDGVCCDPTLPDWRGPDNTGEYYCQATQTDFDDPMHLTDPL